MTSLRILLLAPECNPESVTNPSIGYFQAEALARLHDVTLVLYASNEPAVRRGQAPFRAIEPIRLPLLDRVYEWSLKHVFRFDYGRQSLTAASYPRHVFFEIRAYMKLRHRIRCGEFDVALRILPYNRVFPSPFAWLLRKASLPFVIGPISGGLPWPAGFRQLERQKRAAGYRLWSLRFLAQHLPFAKSTYVYADAIIAGSSHTYAELLAYREKLFFMPTEIGVNPSLFVPREEGEKSTSRKLELVFAGRLIPLKACDLAIRSAAALLRADLARLTVVGDGPERQYLSELTKSLAVDEAVSFVGWLSHQETLSVLRRADVLVFPSLREIGGGVVFEALASGTVPIVVDFGGPGDLVSPEIGCKIPLSCPDEMSRQIERALGRFVEDRDHLAKLSKRGMTYARETLTYDARARTITEILLWAVGRGAKPALEPPGPERGDRPSV